MTNDERQLNEFESLAWSLLKVYFEVSLSKIMQDIHSNENSCLAARPEHGQTYRGFGVENRTVLSCSSVFHAECDHQTTVKLRSP